MELETDVDVWGKRAKPSMATWKKEIPLLIAVLIAVLHQMAPARSLAALVFASPTRIQAYP